MQFINKIEILDENVKNATKWPFPKYSKSTYPFLVKVVPFIGLWLKLP